MELKDGLLLMANAIEPILANLVLATIFGMLNLNLKEKDA